MTFNRREFGRALAGGVALGTIPRIGHTQEPGRKVGYCIVGLGRISMQHFMPACKMSQHSQVTALVSGHRDKAEKMAAEYNVPTDSIYSYENYDEIRNNKNIDAVYIALPNSMHSEYTIRAANALKHILCEKPMATTVKDCQAMIASAKAANRKLMIAYRCQYEPVNTRAVQMIRDGKIGKIEAIESANGFYEVMGEWRLDRKLAGGGPMMDVGIYSLNACRYLTGEEPTRLEGYSSVIDHDGRFETVEENLSWTMKFPSGAVASCNTTYGANMPGFYRVHGSKGIIHLEPAFAYQGLHLKAEIKGESPIDDLNTDKDPAQFVMEADYFSDCVLNDKEPKSNGEEGLRDMQLIAKVYQSAGLKMG
ncbi:MAG TPA: Gfo/Idh/MocA family oxidoreductase [Bryobacteraceae bacterium]|jgi:predicted dehydrogenase|nr:Gfo/Idh/MocA family oxidoreductase [Bryobacteraceae bacterium]